MEYSKISYSTYSSKRKWYTVRFDGSSHHYVGGARVRKHLNFKRYIYRDGRKVFTATCKEVRELYTKAKEQHEMWEKLND